ncbi:reprolysin-like metallopeptidase [Flavobacterium sp.]|uniref:reprolysin-like metallopeptidase n=1 Tax=Flavobacterium sp. TaxID=239 RepID=UPI0035285AD4
MKKTLLLVILTFFSLNLFSQKSIWTKVSKERVASLEKMDRDVFPSKYALFQMNFNEFKQLLLAAPMETEASSNLIVDFPSANGTLSKYKIFEAPIMEKELADKFPDIKSYVAIGIDNPASRLRFSVTLFGLHVMSLSGGDTFYIDTYTKDLNNYIVYNRKNISSVRTFACHFEDDPEEIARVNKLVAESKAFATDGKFRQYRLAMACTIEYAAYHITAAGLGTFATLAQKKAAVLSAMNVTMTRVNGIYETDMSLRMNLVGNNDAIIFVNSDSFDNDNAGTLINQSQSVINSTIGSSNYDIGHTVSTGGGGLAGLGVVCNNSQKARGITGSPAPVGDPYDVDYVAHEMGHQFGGPHTFSGTGGSCTGNGSAANAVEPGSGSTIMAYAGICTSNVQSNSDPYFHAVSIASMNAVMIGSGNCAPQTNNNNNTPIISALSNYTIPKGTAFALTGNATDADAGASLTYCWEQTNAASGINEPTATQTSGPNYRSFNPTPNPTRYFPKLSDLFTGNLTTTTWEVTPTVTRTLNFALTVRDNQMPTGGQTARANMTVTIDASKGPLSVTSQNTDGIVWAPGSTETITWAVNNTNASVGGTNVDILYTIDNGETWNVLLANTPNDGSQAITVPSITAPYCRIMVKASENIFFSVNTKNIAIGNYTYQTQNICEDYEFNLNYALTESSDGNYPGIALPITDSYTITDIKTYADVTHPNIGQVNILFWFPWSTGLNTGVWYNQTACTNANMDKWFDLAGATPDCSTVGGSPFLPYSTGNFTGAIGQNSAGDWRIYTKDVVVDGSGGVLNTFTIQLCRSEVVPVLTSETFETNDFVIYPNPNNGVFNIKLTANTNDVSINVHDLRGRLILSKNLKASGLVSEQISLADAQTGIYLVTIEDGSRKITKKVVVE